jgi:hypothetical protein
MGDTQLSHIIDKIVAGIPFEESGKGGLAENSQKPVATVRG